MEYSGPALGPPSGSLSGPTFTPPTPANGRLRASRSLLHELMDKSLVLSEDWNRLSHSQQQVIKFAGSDQETLLPLLVQQGLLTEYVASRVLAGSTFGLNFGNYRVLDRLGAGGMGVVFRAEHIYMRRPAAIKVLPLSPDQDPRLLQRFYGEMRSVAQLQHPNIIAAFDAGQLAKPDGSQILHYFVMEYVAGPDLEQHVELQGPLGMVQACDLAHQIACALSEANRHQLVHRDIKPSNILVTSEHQAKLVDFGLALCFDKRCTEPGTVLGTLDYLAPEQAKDASSVDIRADIYGLGGTLFWCLTGRIPFPSGGNMVEDLARRLTQPAPSVLNFRPELPPELNAVVARMMATNPADRYPTPQAVQQALLPFLRPEAAEYLAPAPIAPVAPTATRADGHLRPTRVIPEQNPGHRILIVDDEQGIRDFCRFTLQSEHLHCEDARDGVAGLEKIEQHDYDLLLVDIDMPRMTGLEMCQRLRERRSRSNQKIILFSGHKSPDELALLLSAAGVDDCLSKPFSVVQLRSRVQAALRLKDAQDRSEWLNQHLIAVNQELENNLSARDSDLVHARNALVLALAQLVEYREDENGSHLLRMQKYCRTLAEEAAALPEFAARVTSPFLNLLECCAPLHDIGKVALPDHILLKPGKLEVEERLLMQTHTTIGADILQRVAGRHGPALGFLQMAIDIARYHHERFDGTGYPDRVAGNQIPLAARIVTIADVYDALRSRRQYKPALSHAAAVQVMQASSGQFDPLLLQALGRCAPKFDGIFREIQE